MKIARIEVEICDDCPYVLVPRYGPATCMATEVEREIQDTVETPIWCPLPDAPKKEKGAGL
jgi:hypothetical protein